MIAAILTYSFVAISVETAVSIWKCIIGNIEFRESQTETRLESLKIVRRLRQQTAENDQFQVSAWNI